jgi:lipopolysaccharide heptosyltransferase II
MRKVCVIHRASIGDTLLATPVYRAVKECYPETELVVLTSHVGYELLNGNPYINTLIPYEKGDPIFPVIRKMWRAEAAVILDHHYRDALYAFLARIPKRVGRGKSFINIHIEDSSATLFEPLKYLHIAKQVGIDTENLELTRPVATASEKLYVQELCTELRHDGRKLVLLVPYSLAPIKDWEPEKYREIIRRLQEKDCIVAVTGGKEQFGKIEREFPMAINLAGKTNLRETTELIANADLQLCGCTAMLHVCSTTDTPSIALYGPTTPEQWAPRQRCKVISHMLPCSPCYNVGNRICHDNTCIQEISVDEVWDAISEFLRLW